MAPGQPQEDPVVAEGRARAIAAVRGGDWPFIYLDGHFVGRVHHLSTVDVWRCQPAPSVETWDQHEFATAEEAAEVAYDAWLPTPDGAIWRHQATEKAEEH